MIRSGKAREGSRRVRHWRWAACLAMAVWRPAPSQIPITFDVAHAVDTLRGWPIGIDVNYLKDDDHLRPAARPLSQALGDMGAGWLRYPGGEKSDWHLWSQAPYDKPRPVAFGYYKSQMSDPLDFDEYMVVARAVGAEPFVVVGYDSPRTGISKATYLENAVEWVRYANVTRGYGVKYWEIGNENWNNSTGSPDSVARDVANMARAMKAVDPSIKIGASGNGEAWWNAYLAVYPELDFFTLSDYPGPPGGFAEYASKDSWSLLGPAAGALRALGGLPAAQRAGKTVIITEFNAHDWTDHWKSADDLGHALLNVETIGQILSEPRISAAMLWTTRWMDWQNPDQEWYALDAGNGLLPPGRVLAIWRRFRQDRMVSVDRAPGLVSFAMASRSGDQASVLLVNKRSQTQWVDLSALGAPAYSAAEIYRFAGSGDTDTHPVWARLADRAPAANRLPGLELPGVSLTVVSLRTRDVAILPHPRPSREIRSRPFRDGKGKIAAPGVHAGAWKASPVSVTPLFAVPLPGPSR